jgi:hypothetical protein
MRAQVFEGDRLALLFDQSQAQSLQRIQTGRRAASQACADNDDIELAVDVRLLDALHWEILR